MQARGGAGAGPTLGKWGLELGPGGLGKDCWELGLTGARTIRAWNTPVYPREGAEAEQG